jgi:hypothetical protein
MTQTVTLGTSGLTQDEVVAVARHGAKVVISPAALEAMLPMMQLGAFLLLIDRKLLWVDLKLASAASRAALAASIINCRRVKPGVPGVLLWNMTLCVDWRFPRAVRESVLLALAHP